MLPVINLDDENFIEIFEEARQMISGVYPAWTDYNEHDPGITFLELFSWMKEMQQYHMNQIGKDNYQMYLKLLGMKLQKREPATALVNIYDVQQGYELAKGSKLFAGETGFETLRRELLEEVRIIKCSSGKDSREITMEEGLLQSARNLNLKVFGDNPGEGDEFLIQLDKPLDTGSEHGIYFKMFDEYPVKRNVIMNEEFYPLARHSVWSYGLEGWTRCEITVDETHELIQSGKIYLKIKDTMKEKEGAYFLKIRLEESNYEIPPILREISLNAIKVIQRNTSIEYQDYVIPRYETKENGEGDWSDSQEYELILDSYLIVNGEYEVYLLEERGFCRYDQYHAEYKEDGLHIYLGDKAGTWRVDNRIVRIVSVQKDYPQKRIYSANGFPYQTIALEDPDILYDSLELMVEDEMAPGYYTNWSKVDGFSCSGPADCHYLFDDNKGIIYFGDCENGKAPEGNIIIIGYAVTQGVRGNVKSKQINRTVGWRERFRVLNQDNAYGGRDKETMDSCFKRFTREFRQVKRAITYEDYEQLIRSTPGLMIQNVKAVPLSLIKNKEGNIEENCVTVVVQPYNEGKKSSLNTAYRNNILCLLDKRRLVGTKVNLLSPEYIGISIYVEAVIKPHYINASDIIKKAVEDYFGNVGAEFGKPVLYNEIYGTIDILDCVSQVRNISINTQGKGITRSMNQDLILPSNGIVYLKEAHYSISL